MKNLICLFIIALHFQPMQAQLEAELSIKNVEISGGEVLFDVYLRQSGSTTETINLGHSDFLIYADETEAVFVDPTFNKVDNPTPPYGTFLNGYCTFEPVNSDGSFKSWNCQSLYFGSTFTDIVEGYDVININAPTISDQTAFDNNIAIIDDKPDVHRLGRFSIDGYQSGSVQLLWKPLGQGFQTKVFTFDNVPPFYGTRVPVTFINSDIVEEPTALIPQGSENWSVNILPNPATNQISLEIGKIPTETTHYEIFDALGCSHQSGKIIAKQTDISLEKMPSGVYWLQLKNEKGETQSHKFVKLGV